MMNHKMSTRNLLRNCFFIHNSPQPITAHPPNCKHYPTSCHCFHLTVCTTHPSTPPRVVTVNHAPPNNSPLDVSLLSKHAWFDQSQPHTERTCHVRSFSLSGALSLHKLAGSSQRRSSFSSCLSVNVSSRVFLSCCCYRSLL